MRITPRIKMIFADKDMFNRMHDIASVDTYVTVSYAINNEVTKLLELIWRPIYTSLVTHS